MAYRNSSAIYVFSFLDLVPSMLHATLLLVLWFFFVGSSFAGQVRVTPSVSIKESYTDNVLLAPKNQEQGEFITEIAPSINLTLQGNKINANVNYTLQNLNYLKDSRRNETFSQLAANSNATLIDDILFFDANASHNQQVVNADLPVANNNLAVTNNRTNVTRYTLSPFLQHSFRNAFDASLRYNYSAVEIRDTSLNDSTQTGINLQLDSATNVTGMSWGLNYSQTKNDNETGNDSEFISGSVRLGYRFTARTNLYATKGKEDNTFTVSGSQDIRDSFWNVGLDWQPGSQDTFLFEYGERFFGNTERFSWRHNARRLVIDLNYQEELSTFSSSLQENQQVDFNTSITSQVFVRERGGLTLSYNFSKTSFSLGYSDENQKFQDTGSTTRTKNANASVALRSSATLTYNLGLGWSNRFTPSTQLKSSTSRINVSIQKRIQPRLTAEMSINHRSLRSSNNLLDFDENILSLSITQVFN